MKEKLNVWVVGGSSGLGLAAAEAFAQKGHRVVSGARSFAGLQNNEGSAQQNPLRLALDVNNEESCNRFIAQALQACPHVDVLICGAALLVLGSCERTSIEELELVMQTNFLGTVRMVRKVLPLMRERESGKIIIFSSINGLLGIPYQSAYSASKHALEGYAECLAMETKQYGIKVCLVEPGDHRGGSQHTRLHAMAENEASPYHKSCLAACAVIRHDEENGLYPARFGDKLVKCVCKKHMRFRVHVAKADQLLAIGMHDFLPPWLHFKILMNYYQSLG